MNWESDYKAKLRTAHDAIRENICSGDKVYGGGASVAVTCLNAMLDEINAGSLTGIEMVINGPCNGKLNIRKGQFSREQLKYPAMFLNPPDRYYMEQETCSFMPLQFGMYNRYIESLNPDAAVIIMSPPDEKGNCCVGPYGFVPVPMRNCKKIIGQISQNIPRICGTSHCINVSEMDAIVEADDPIAVLESNRSVTDIEQKIAENILNYIEDGACVQLGIGGIANAIGFGLEQRKHLGIHTEVLTDSVVELMEKGAVDNSRKKVFPGASAIGFVLGTERQNKFIADNKDLIFGRFDEIVNISNIASNDHMISINAAISVDLTGQVCAESIGHRQYSGTGGQLDFVRGASLSKNGYSFIALPSTADTKNGRISRIVPELLPGSIVTTPRTDVHYIATEYGCVNLMFSDVPERVRKMISIAHPDYRDELLSLAKKNHLI